MKPFAEALAKLDRERAPNPSDYDYILKHILENGHRWQQIYSQGVLLRHIIESDDPMGHIQEDNIHAFQPRLITEMVINVLQGINDGSTAPNPSPSQISICKHTREELLGNKSPLWQRSPLWLLLRVSLQLISERAVQQSGAARGWYKDFMIFLLALLLRDASDTDQPHDMLFVMMGKVSHRMLKAVPTQAPWLSFVERILTDVQSTLGNGWADIQNSAVGTLDLSPLQALDFAGDTRLKLTTLRPYLKKVSNRPPLTGIARAGRADDHNPRRRRRGRVPDGKFSLADHSLLLYELADFEEWVESHLQVDNLWNIRGDAASPTTTEIGGQPPVNDEDFHTASEGEGFDVDSNEAFPIFLADVADKASDTLTVRTHLHSLSWFRRGPAYVAICLLGVSRPGHYRTVPRR